MTKKAAVQPVEIKLGHASYHVEREFVGTDSREEVLIKKLVEDCFEQVHKSDRDKTL